MQSLYEWDFSGKKPDELSEIVERNIKEFGPGLEDPSFVWQLITGVVDHISEIDQIISKAAPQWPISQISLVDRNVLRIGLYELLYAKKEEVPPKVAINEAIELAKNFGGESSGKFVNGVLGTVFKEIGGEEKENVSKSDKEFPEEVLVGGIVYRIENNNCQIALIQDIFDRWTLPKGHVEEGENLEQAVLREVKEEIGLEKLKIIKNLGERVYMARDPEKEFIKRKVTDFLIESADFGRELKAEENKGIREARWFNFDDIHNLKQYKEPKEIIEKVIEDLKKK